ncbi:hypothetical protein Q3G72_017634 [Acer saccharum]|nr:hypothetical protein Q3G72_017634 [Acer saccharum]
MGGSDLIFRKKFRKLVGVVGGGKISWSDLVEARGEDAIATIEKERPGTTAYIVPHGAVVIPDYSCTRVWAWVNTSGIVKSVPKVG